MFVNNYTNAYMNTWLASVVRIVASRTNKFDDPRHVSRFSCTYVHENLRTRIRRLARPV